MVVMKTTKFFLVSLWRSYIVDLGWLLLFWRRHFLMMMKKDYSLFFVTDICAQYFRNQWRWQWLDHFWGEIMSINQQRKWKERREWKNVENLYLFKWFCLSFESIRFECFRGPAHELIFDYIVIQTFLLKITNTYTHAVDSHFNWLLFFCLSIKTQTKINQL